MDAHLGQILAGRMVNWVRLNLSVLVQGSRLGWNNTTREQRT